MSRISNHIIFQCNSSQEQTQMLVSWTHVSQILVFGFLMKHNLCMTYSPENHYIQVVGYLATLYIT